MPMYSLFDTKSTAIGFRLQYMEIYNWGTFDGQVFRIAPNGNNSLLTGANGSGKTTYIDALLTLMVATQKDRFYNQSSGVKKKGDRTEESYVCGHYGDIQEEGKTRSTIQKLRDKRTYSILLANFTNAEDKTITLFQVRWFLNGQLKRVFGVAKKALSIEKDFYPFDNKGNWKRRLDKEYNVGARKYVEFINGPKKYGARMVSLFGMRSPKALSLFNQIVGIKVLGNLDEFIRTNMLEEQQAEKEFIQLKESFLTLMDAKTNIEKAKEQITQLQPINQQANQLAGVKNNIQDKTYIKDLSIIWFAEKGIELSQEMLRKIEQERQQEENALNRVKEKQEELRATERSLSIQIEKDEVGQQIRNLEREIRSLTKQKESRLKKLNRYSREAEALSLDQNPSEAIFYESRELAKQQKRNCEDQIIDIDNELFELKKQEENLAIRIEEIAAMIHTLRKNRNNISGRLAEIREEIMYAVGAERGEIPFIGELLKVREEERSWESAIERLLHNFALGLIVPERYYDAINNYVNATNLRGRIVYHRCQNEILQHHLSPPRNRHALHYKLDYNTKSQYWEWVEKQIIERFDYICTQNLHEFRNYNKAITLNGLIKSGRGRHEKDDRKKVLSRDNYVLGWDNKEKLRFLKLEMNTYKQEQNELKTQIKEKNKTKRNLAKKRDAYQSFYSSFTDFDEINWKTYAQEIQDKTEKKELLEQTNNRVKELQRQLAEVKTQLKELITEGEILLKSIAKKENRIEQLTEELEEYRNILQIVPEITDKAIGYQKLLSAYKYLAEIDYATYKKQQNTFREKNRSQIKKLEQEKIKIENRLRDLVRKFKNPSEHINQRFKDWRSDVHRLPDDIEYIQEYQNLLASLEAENLPKFEKKFNEYLTQTIIHKVGDFKLFFDNWESNIKDNIAALNEALFHINFKKSPQTYIQLIAQAHFTQNSRRFRKLLKEAIPDFARVNKSMDYRKTHFEKKIKPLIDELSEERWRKEVMDVRAWFKYYAEEFYRENGQKWKSYKNMGQLSGGEKAQLTYTILGSAIAYQFGLTKGGKHNDSFRFIAIDEAFKAQDEDKAKYLMELCQQLHLQLLVVTPSDNIHIVEPYISFVHFIERRNDKNSWLYDMPIEQFQEQRKLLQVESIAKGEQQELPYE